MVTPNEGALLSLVDTGGNDRAIYQAYPKRFRPIIMSIMAAMFGPGHWHAGRRFHVVDQLL
jgi:hypothetical protein